MFHRPLEIEMIRAETAEFTKRKIKAGQFGRNFQAAPPLIKAKLASQWMKDEADKPAPKPLFGGFWQQNELCILFADTNMGKSILAVQIADSLTRDYSIEPFANKAEYGTKALYLDFEQSAKQFETRYTSSAHGCHYFADTFYRAELDPVALPDVIYYKNYNDYVSKAIESTIKEMRPQVLIIDNITYMRSAIQHAGDALDLMKTLKELKTKYNLSILVLAHTPKRNARKPITVNDLQGSKMLINFADSAFAIGQSNTIPNMRYLKQIKQRNQGELYGENNICLISLENQHSFLQYKFEGYGREHDHLQPVTRSDINEQQVNTILQMHRDGHTLRKIAEAAGLHYTTVGKIVRRGTVL